MISPGLCTISGTCKKKSVTWENQFDLDQSSTCGTDPPYNCHSPTKNTAQDKEACLNRALYVYEECDNDMDQPITVAIVTIAGVEEEIFPRAPYTNEGKIKQ